MNEKYVDFKVSWIELATVEVMKKDSAADVNLAGAVFGIYSDTDCKNLITTMPETDSNGKSSERLSADLCDKYGLSVRFLVVTEKDFMVQDSTSVTLISSWNPSV